MEENVHTTEMNISTKKEEDQESMQSVRLEFTDGTALTTKPEPDPNALDDGGAADEDQGPASSSLGDFDFGTEVKVNLAAADVDENEQATAL